MFLTNIELRCWRQIYVNKTGLWHRITTRRPMWMVQHIFFDRWRHSVLQSMFCMYHNQWMTWAISKFEAGCVDESSSTSHAMASQITSLTTVYWTVYSGADQRKHQSSASLAFVHGIHRWPVNSPHKWPVTRKMVPFDDVIMSCPGRCWGRPGKWVPQRKLWGEVPVTDFVKILIEERTHRDQLLVEQYLVLLKHRLI